MCKLPIEPSEWQVPKSYDSNTAVKMLYYICAPFITLRTRLCLGCHRHRWVRHWGPPRTKMKFRATTLNLITSQPRTHHLINVNTQAQYGFYTGVAFIKFLITVCNLNSIDVLFFAIFCKYFYLYLYHVGFKSDMYLL